jgi:hypothetical protein
MFSWTYLVCTSSVIHRNRWKCDFPILLKNFCYLNYKNMKRKGIHKKICERRKLEELLLPYSYWQNRQNPSRTDTRQRPGQPTLKWACVLTTRLKFSDSRWLHLYIDTVRRCTLRRFDDSLHRRIYSPFFVKWERKGKWSHRVVAEEKGSQNRRREWHTLMMPPSSTDTNT